MGAARQTALMAATGDYLLFADSDDMLPEDAVEKLAGKADSSHADLIDGGYLEWCDGKAGMLQKPFEVSDEKLLKLLVCQNIITNRLWGRIYKRSLIMEHRIFFEEGINYAEDLFWNAQFMFYGKKVNIDDAVYYYRTDNENSYNHNISEKNLLSYFKSTRRLIDFFEQNDTEHQYLRATEIGIVNAYRWAANAHVAFEKVDQALDYKPKSCLISLIISLIKKGVPVKRVNLIYLAYRKLYTLLISAPSAVS